MTDGDRWWEKGVREGQARRRSLSATRSEVKGRRRRSRRRRDKTKRSRKIRYNFFPRPIHQTATTIECNETGESMIILVELILLFFGGKRPKEFPTKFSFPDPLCYVLTDHVLIHICTYTATRTWRRMRFLAEAHLHGGCNESLVIWNYCPLLIHYTHTKAQQHNSRVY